MIKVWRWKFQTSLYTTEDYSFAVTVTFDMPVKTEGNLSQTLLLALTVVEMSEFGALIFGWKLNVSRSRDAAGEATT